MVKKTYISNFSGHCTHNLVDGRILVIHLRHSEMDVLLICVHLHDNTDEGKDGLVRKLWEFIRNRTHMRIFVFGDFNFVSCAEDRTLLANGSSVGKPCHTAVLWDELFGDFAEFNQRSHTRFPGDFNNNGAVTATDILSLISLYGYYCD